MDSKQFIEGLSESLGMSREDVQKLITGLSSVMADVAIDMDVTSVSGFGGFEPRKRRERIAMQPSTSKRLLLPPKLLLGFRPSAILKQRIK